MDNILAVKATGEFTEDTNISAVVEGGNSTLSISIMPLSRNVSALSLTRKRRKGWPSLTRGNGQANRRKGSGRQSRRGFPDLGLKDKNAGMEFEVGNIFIDGDILLLRMTLTNRTQIGYTTDFMRFYIQDAKIHKKTAVQQIEQNILFAFDYPEEIPAHESRTFTVAMNKFTIPDKKRLIIEIQERNGGRHFLYKLKNKSLLGAEEVFRSLQEQKTEDEADRILRRISR